jgi:hypothetical protein
LNGEAVILPTIKIILENHAGNACCKEYSIRVELFGQTFANCFILPPKREDIPATIYTNEISLFINQILKTKY